MPAPHVAGGEHLVERGAIVLGIGLDVAARIERHAHRLDHAVVHRVGKTHCQQNEIGLDVEFGARNRLELVVDAHAMKRLHLPVVAAELVGHHREVALGAFLVAR